MTDHGPDTPLVKAVDRSGFPFQLAVERDLRSLGQRHGWHVIATEVPLGNTFAYIVLRRENCLAAVECKRVDGERWQFLVPTGASNNVVRCRVEWHNPRAPSPIIQVPHSHFKVFCAECTMCEGSYEAGICVLPKTKADHSLEALSRGLLSTTNELADLDGLKYDGVPTYVIPVVVTNAELSVCEYDTTSLDIAAGRLGKVSFRPVDFLRFRKTLVHGPSNDYMWREPVSLEAWTSDRERTVFVVSPRGLDRFLSGFRAFRPAGEGEHPVEFESPPSW